MGRLLNELRGAGPQTPCPFCSYISMSFRCGLYALLLIASLSMSGCLSHERPGSNNPDNAGEEVSLVAEVRWIPLEGGFYGLLTQDGRRFLPINLPDEFRKDGLRVTVKGRIKEVATIYMWGKPFEVHKIEVYNPQN